jgi:hypothetical protein
MGMFLIAQPAEACHRFSRWYYPHPQRCYVNNTHRFQRIAMLVPAPVAKPTLIADQPLKLPVHTDQEFLDLVIIPPNVPEWDDIEREIGVEKLKILLKRKQTEEK